MTFPQNFCRESNRLVGTLQKKKVYHSYIFKAFSAKYLERMQLVGGLDTAAIYKLFANNSNQNLNLKIVVTNFVGRRLQKINKDCYI